MGFFKKLKELMTDYPKKPRYGLVELLLVLPARQNNVLETGFPFHIEWKSQEIRRDN